MNRRKMRGNNKTRRSHPINYGKFICPKCNLVIDDILQALTDPITEEPIHFDCAKESILKNEKIPDDCELSYLGKGDFGIVQFEKKNISSNHKFKILKTINFEPQRSDRNWRNLVQEKFEKTLEQNNH